MIGYLALAAYAATIPAANWMIGNVGECIPNGPCLIPVGFGLMAPSGVLMIGAALVLRDAVHSLLGWKWAAAAILVGAALSFTFSPAALVIASVTAFLLSELADLAVYSPLRRKRLVLAVFASGAVGAVVDSAVFLWLAFGSLDFIAGQIIGKLWMTALAAAVLAASYRRARA
jgi:queuosine precursor transporter